MINNRFNNNNNKDNFSSSSSSSSPSTIVSSSSEQQNVSILNNMMDTSSIHLEDTSATSVSNASNNNNGDGNEAINEDSKFTRGRSNSRTKAMDLNLVKSKIPGASQFFPAAALVLALITLLITIIINRATFNPETCPKGPDFFVLATNANISKSWCVEHKMCEYEIENNLLPTKLANNNMNVSDYLKENPINCLSDIGGIDYPLFSDAGVDPPQFWIFAPGLTITAIFVIMLVGENFLRQQIGSLTRKAVKKDKATLDHTTFEVLKYVSLVCGLCGGICLIGLSWCTVKNCNSHLIFAFTFFGSMVLFQISNTIASRIQLKWAMSKQNKHGSRQSAKREKILRLRRKSLRYKYIVMGFTFLFFCISYLIGIPVTSNLNEAGKYCNMWWEIKPNQWIKDSTIDCCGQTSTNCYSLNMMRSTTQSLSIISLLTYLLTFWNDFRIDPSAEVEAVVIKATKRLSMVFGLSKTGGKKKLKAVTNTIIATNRMLKMTTGKQSVNEAASISTMSGGV